MNRDEKERAIRVLEQTIPFRYLDKVNFDLLLHNAETKEYNDGEKILSRFDKNTHVYVILVGKVVVLREDGKVVDTLSEKSYFGERSHLLREAITHNFVSSDGCTCLVIVSENFKMVTSRHSGFSMSLARSLREKQGIFSALDKFRVHLSNGVSQGRLDFARLVSLYKEMQPAIHHKLNSHEIDTDSWIYALKRLPTNITSTLTIIMSKRMTNVLSDEYLSFSCKGDVRTVGRRRSTWNLIPGKIFVLIRDTSTDIIDFVSCLCLHQVEAAKLRTAVKASNIAGDLRKVVATGLPEKPSEQDIILKKLKVSDYERQGLKSLWPKTVITELYNILLQHGDYNILIDQGLNNYNMDISEHWSSRVKQAAIEALGTIHEEHLEIDIISSNTHSVLNCLSPYVHAHRDEILEWGKTNKPDLFQADFKNEDDRLYGLCYFFFKAYPEKEIAREIDDKQCGIVTLPEEDFTGITVQIIIPERLKSNNMDKFLSPIFNEYLTNFDKKSEKKRAIINIDFAFGKQAEDIIGCLIAVFRQSIKSVNILGKAGGLIGNRGDILLPTHLIYQESDELRSVPNFGLDAREIQEMSGRTVHVGPMLTILGTLLQNKTLLHYYLEFYKVVGLEMEASFFARQVERAVMMEILNYGIQTRFIYYVSDIPTDENSTLSKSMSSSEGIPPLYTITRGILKQILLRYKATRGETIIKESESENVTPSHSGISALATKTPATIPHPGSAAWHKLQWALRVVKQSSFRHDHDHDHTHTRQNSSSHNSHHNSAEHLEKPSDSGSTKSTPSRHESPQPASKSPQLLSPKSLQPAASKSPQPLPMPLPSNSKSPQPQN